ncbi:unnamed protein product, partial [Closterium sp. NIES-54]
MKQRVPTGLGLTSVDNQDVLELVEGNQGILALLDSACKLDSSTPETFCQTLYSTLGKHKRFSKSKMSRSDFSVKHYAGKVKYQAEEFLVKNLDALVPEHEELLARSHSDFVRTLFPPPETGKAVKAVSLGKRFKEQLGELMRTLNATEPHYVRCVKPNKDLKPQKFSNTLVVEQLRSGGVLEAVRLCSTGYPARRTFEDFEARFSLLLPSPDRKRLAGQHQEIIGAVMAQAELQDYQVGKTKVFMKGVQLVTLESLRLDRMNLAATKIQRAVRRFLWKQERKRAAIVIQKHWKAYRARKLLRELREDAAALVIQKHLRRFLMEKRFWELKFAAIVIQKNVRMQQARKRYILLRRTLATIVIQRYWRGHRVRKPWGAMRRCLQVKVARMRLKKMKEAAQRAALLAPPRTKVEASMDELRIAMLRGLKQREEKKRHEAEESVKRLTHEMATLNHEISQLKAALNKEKHRAEKAEELLRLVPRSVLQQTVAHQGFPRALSRTGSVSSYSNYLRSRGPTAPSSPKVEGGGWGAGTGGEEGGKGGGGGAGAEATGSVLSAAAAALGGGHSSSTGGPTEHPTEHPELRIPVGQSKGGGGSVPAARSLRSSPSAKISPSSSSASSSLSGSPAGLVPSARSLRPSPSARIPSSFPPSSMSGSQAIGRGSVVKPPPSRGPSVGGTGGPGCSSDGTHSPLQPGPELLVAAGEQTGSLRAGSDGSGDGGAAVATVATADVAGADVAGAEVASADVAGAVKTGLGADLDGVRHSWKVLATLSDDDVAAPPAAADAASDPPPPAAAWQQASQCSRSTSHVVSGTTRSSSMLKALAGTGSMSMKEGRWGTAGGIGSSSSRNLGGNSSKGYVGSGSGSGSGSRSGRGIAGSRSMRWGAHASRLSHVSTAGEVSAAMGIFMVATTREEGLGGLKEDGAEGGGGGGGGAGEATAGGAEAGGKSSSPWSRVRALAPKILQVASETGTGGGGAVRGAGGMGMGMGGGPSSSWSGMFAAMARSVVQLEELREEVVAMRGALGETERRLHEAEERAESAEGEVREKGEEVEELRGQVGVLMERLKSKDNDVRQLSETLSQHRAQAASAAAAATAHSASTAAISAHAGAHSAGGAAAAAAGGGAGFNPALARLAAASLGPSKPVAPLGGKAAPSGGVSPRPIPSISVHSSYPQPPTSPTHPQQQAAGVAAGVAATAAAAAAGAGTAGETEVHFGSELRATQSGAISLGAGDGETGEAGSKDSGGAMDSGGAKDSASALAVWSVARVASGEASGEMMENASKSLAAIAYDDAAIARIQENPPESVLIFLTTHIIGLSPQGLPLAAPAIYRTLLHFGAFPPASSPSAPALLSSTIRHLQAAILPEEETLSISGEGVGPGGVPAVRVNEQCYWLSNVSCLMLLVEVVYKPAAAAAAAEKPKTAAGSNWFTNMFQAPSFSDATRQHQQHQQQQQPALGAVEFLVFKQELAVLLDDAFLELRASVNLELQTLVSLLTQSPTANAQHMREFWAAALVSLRSAVGCMQANRVPTVLARHLLWQVLHFLDVRLFNGLMLRSHWCPITLANGEAMEQGLLALEAWLSEDVHPWLDGAAAGMGMSRSVGSLGAGTAAGSVGGGSRALLIDALQHTYQAVVLLTSKQKARKTMEEVVSMCPSLNFTQLTILCSWFEDEVYGSRGFDRAVLQQLRGAGEDYESELLEAFEG